MPAEAASIGLNADAWKFANGRSVFSVDGVTATAGALTTLTYDAKNGLGVTYVAGSVAATALDEPSATQLVLPPGPVSALTLSVVNSRAIQGFTVLQKTHATKGDAVGYYSVNGDAWQSLMVANNGQGAFDVILGQNVISQIAFAANPAFEKGFWVRSIEATDVEASVVEPASTLLVGAGLLLGASRLRRRR